MYKNGKRETKTNRVIIKGKKGYKMVTIRNKAGLKKSRKRLTRKEIKCIKDCQFIPGLFKDCVACLK
jgi:hypothetical protein